MIQQLAKELGLKINQVEEIIKLIDKRIDEGYNVVIWPSELKVKDINDMVLAGLDPEQIVRENAKSGLQAKMALNMWKKV